MLAPTAVADIDVVNEDVSVIVDVLANDTDLDANHAFTLDTVSSEKGSVSINANQLEFTAVGFDYLQVGQTEDVIVNYEMSDENGVTSTSIVTITVTGTNDAPIAVADTGTVDEDSTVTLDVLSNDTDLDNNHSLSLDSATTPKGSVSINSSNQLVFTASGFDHLGFGETENVLVTYIMSDEYGETSTNTVTITVTGTNDAPTAVLDSDVVDENEIVTVDLLLNDIDLDDNHVFTLDSVVSDKGDLSINSNNQLVFTANATDFDHLQLGQTEQVVVTYIMSDEANVSSSSTVTITVTGTNDIPVAVADTGAVVENETVTIDVLSNDTDLDDSHIFTLVSVTVDKGLASIDSNNQLVFSATEFDYLDLGETEDVVVSYIMSDENGATSTSSVVITVTGTANAPEVSTLTTQSIASNDLFVGGDSSDTLIVGLGDDTVTGDSGANTFVWQSGDTGTDHITNFSASEGDAIDLSDILHVDDTHTLNDYLHLSSDGTNTTLEIFVDGDANEEGIVEQTIILDGVNTDSVFVVNNLFDGESTGPLIIVDDQTADYSNGVIVQVPDEQHL
ncbi:Ig-like domain-containing protein [Psychromonas sp. KJ10-10]|uniref:Ig-like domain-containing protein n=1 Tax=Psychromonas sp. KJ10-10 TaxID=3391823 RepID=UPI0039B4AFC3